MKNHAQVCVIGGGVVGCSVLYHLTKLGWSDVVLVERSELTSGSTWHAAGGFHTINGDTNMAALQGYTIRLYRELEQITGLSCGLHHVGGLTFAESEERMDMFRAERAKHRFMGLETHIVSPDEIAKIAYLTNLEGVIGGLYNELDGHLDPSGTTHAYAKAATMAGAEVHVRNPVLELNQRVDGSWEVATQNGTIHAEHIVNAAGLWAREVGKMAGVYLPLHPMEHTYLVTEEIPELATHETEYPHVVDPQGENYLRQEGKGLCIGFYEKTCKPWAVDGTPADFGHELLPDDLDRISDSIDHAYHRYPALENAGVKRVINGPFTFTPDGNPLVGPVPGLRNFWSACGVTAGFSQAGGVGLMLAQWMIEGETERNTFALDVARFGPWINASYTLPKVTEFYRRRFSIVFPNEELPEVRPGRVSPMFDVWTAKRAVFGSQYGTEVVNYFARPDETGFETPTFRRSNAWYAIREEVQAVRNGVGINEIHNFGKYRVVGDGARDWLDYVLAGRIPNVGSVSLNPMLSPRGRIIGDFTVTCISECEFQLTASYSAQAFHMRWFDSQLPPEGVRIENVSDRLSGFQIAGPNSRALLQKVLPAQDVASKLQFLGATESEVGRVNALIQRISYTGGLGYEIFVDMVSVRTLFDILWDAGQSFDLKPFGMRAMMSLRLDKFFGSWMREYSPDYTCGETGLDRFIAWKKETEFIGRKAVFEEQEQKPSRKICAFEVEANGADVWGYEPIWIDGEVAGFCTSGGYSHFADKSVAFGFVPTDLISDSLTAEIEILGELRPARRLLQPLYDANNQILRG